MVAAGGALAICATGMGTPALGAQTPGREPFVVELPSSTRAMGLGLAYPVASADPDVLFHHPALIRDAGGVLAGVLASDGGGLGVSLTTARGWWKGNIGVGIRTASYESPGLGRRPGGVDPFTERSEAGLGDAGSIGEIAASFGYAQRLFGFDAGLALQLIRQSGNDARATLGALDVGLSRDVGPVTAALSVRNIGREVDPGGVGTAAQPVTGTLAVGSRTRPLGPLDVGGSAALSLRDDGKVVFGGGVEMGYWPVRGRTFSARVGGHSVPEGDASPLTLGGSFRGDTVILDYAWQPIDGDDLHRISFGWR